ncbi:MAG: MoxR family ATPase [Lachnospiraceae bacterium]|nr:MoxR family ATPase [Lachnospiraceae bacterium]
MQNDIAGKLKKQIGEYFVGKNDVTDKLLICLLAGGHVLLEDVPGVGKTTLAKTLAASVDMTFGRIQFTPDTLPGDVVGASVFNMKTSEFEYREGAIQRQIILADEINRTSPKTQSALLEAMAEGSVTVDGTVYKLPEPFMVIATQNPVEFIGTFPLPEASLDRFMMRLSLGYPDHDEEIRMVKNFLEGKKTDAIGSICTAEDIIKLRREVEKVQIKDNVIEYARNIIDMTRKESSFVIGASSRAFLYLIRAAQADAFLRGRDYVKPDDIKDVAVCTLHHRLSLTSEAKIKKENVDSILKALILKVKVPMEKTED